MTTHTNPRRVSDPGLGLPIGAPAPPPASLARLGEEAAAAVPAARGPAGEGPTEAEAAAAVLLRSCGRARRDTSKGGCPARRPGWLRWQR